MREFNLDSIDPLASAIIERSEAATRAAIERLPDGSYESEMWSDGFEEPVLLKAKVTIDGSNLTVDHAGSSPQSRYGINVVMNYTHAYTSFAVKCAISPEVPHNEGSFRPVKVVAPPGCILNAQHPAPVAARHLIGHFLPGLIFGALAQAMPDRLMADGAASIWITMFRGQRPRADPYTFMLFQCGGTGARPTKDGLNNVGFPSGVAGVPAEVMESLTGLVVQRREVRGSERAAMVHVGYVRPPEIRRAGSARRQSRPARCVRAQRRPQSQPEGTPVPPSGDSRRHGLAGRRRLW
jgi:N-methylhydantoinase B